MDEQEISLNGEWTLCFALETSEMRDDPLYLRQHGERISAQVPGNVELDLQRAGIEPDPFYGENLYQYRKYEFYRWQFERDFRAPERNASRWLLIFEGLNNFSRIYINDALVGESDNSFIRHTFDVTEALRYGENNHITVIIRSATNEARHMDAPAMAFTLEANTLTLLRMPASSFGWDIMGRFLSAGMWRGVMLAEQKPTRIEDAYYAALWLLPNDGVRMRLRYRWQTDAPVLDGFSLRIRGVCGQSVFTMMKNVLFVDGVIDFNVPNARLWWPKGYGEAALYTVTLTLLHGGVAVDERVDRIGIRRFEIKHVPKPLDEGEFQVIVNGCPILCKGSNWVPLDALHSRDKERLRPAHNLLNDLGCNIVRCWGGNVYEDHDFFDLCDERGIMVWQDFAMACAIYSPEEGFAKQLEREAVAVVKKLRNHPSLLLWAGDNEVDESLATQGFVEGNQYNALTRETLARVVRMHDPYRFYLPSSPYIPAGVARYAVPEQHLWGARAYFKDDFYRNSPAHFISECGYHGCPAVNSLARFIPEQEFADWTNSSVFKTHDTDYLLSGARDNDRILLMREQVSLLFGEAPDRIQDFSRLSQISQAEAVKFFIERTRLQKWRRTGIIWWNMLDGWPQISDAVVDYYYTRKLAYYYIRRAQTPIAVLMDELSEWSHTVMLCNDSRDQLSVRYRVEDGDTGEVYIEGERLSPANENVTLGAIRELAGQQRLYLITWEINGRRYGNHYISGYPAYRAEKMLDWVGKISALPEPFIWEC